MNPAETQTELISITGIKDLTITEYFITINQEDFQSTADLFAEDGELLAPFEKPIHKNAIASYLEQEAKGMKLIPLKGVKEITADNLELIKVTGKVQTSLFTVNVGWYFHLDEKQKIMTARIKLLASPQELLGLKKIKDN